MVSPSDLDHLLVGRLVTRGRRASQQRPHSAPELADRERLRDVVVRAELEPDHLVELVVSRRQHHDRHGAARPEPLADLEPVEPRQHHVKHDKVDGLRGETGEGLVPVPRLDDAVSVALERIGQELLDGLLVVD